MKAVRVHKTGGPEVLRLEEVPDLSAGPKDAVVKTEAAGVNFVDIYFRTGLYKATLPFTNGQEGAGVITAVGTEVTDFQPGDRVACIGVLGSYAEYSVVPAAKLVKLPKAIDTRTAAAVMLQGMTVHYLTYSTFPLENGHTALVHAAAGGVGLVLVQVAKMRGARVIGTCSTPDKAARVRQAGADEVVLYTEQDFVAEVKRLTDGRGVDVVYDSVGKDTFSDSIACLQPRGLMVSFGNTSGAVEPFSPAILAAKGSLFLTRPTLATYTATREELEATTADLFDVVGSGAVKIEVNQTYALEYAAQAHRDLEARQTTGSTVLLTGT